MRRYPIGLLIGAMALAVVAGLVKRFVDGDASVYQGRAVAIDGDTLVVEGRRLRLKGIDAPELHQTCGAQGELACGEAARTALARIVRRGVTCTARARDGYGRPLVRCRAPEIEDVAEALVREGQAIADGCCGAAEAAARSAGLGIWSGPFDRPADWRRAHPATPDR